MAGKTEPFAMLPLSVMLSARLSHRAKDVLLLLADYQNRETGQCNPKIATLAGKLECSRRTVANALAELRTAGLVRIEWGQRGSNYKLPPYSQMTQILKRQNDVTGNPDRQKVAHHKILIGKKLPNAIGKKLPIRASASINEPDLLNQRVSVVVVDVPKQRKATAKPAEPPTATATVKKIPPTKNGKTPDPVREIARSLVGDLMREHPKAGEPGKAIAAAAIVLRESADVDATVAVMRRNHPAWVAYWRELPGGSFIPFLDLWFSRSYYDHAPSDAAVETARKPPASQKRKSKLEEMLDAL